MAKKVGTYEIVFRVMKNNPPSMKGTDKLITCHDNMEAAAAYIRDHSDEGYKYYIQEIIRLGDGREFKGVRISIG